MFSFADYEANFGGIGASRPTPISAGASGTPFRPTCPTQGLECGRLAHFDRTGSAVRNVALAVGAREIGWRR
jgi:hypothetical protein